MDLLAQIADANAKVTSLTSERDTLASQLQAANGKVTPLETSVSTLTAERDEALVERDAATTALSDATAAHTTALEGLNTQVTNLTTENTTLKATQKTAEQLALERTGKGGNKGLKGNGETKTVMTKAEALTAYAKLKTPADRSAFYGEHKAIMFPPKS